MIKFSSYYSIAADEIAMIRANKDSDPKFPYNLTVVLKNGETASVGFTKEEDRYVVWQDILAQISREQRQDYERMYNKLYLVEDAVRRIDKRQLRIWRILSKLLPVKEEDVEHDGQ